MRTSVAHMQGQQTVRRISPAERARRAEAVAQASASVALEGFKLTPQEQAHAQRFIDGEIELAEFLTPPKSN